MANTTQRQFNTWMTWLNMEWDRPSLSDHYLMQIACQVTRVLAKDPAKIQPNDFRLKFVSKETEAERISASDTDDETQIQADDTPLSLRNQAAAISKSMWLGRMTMPVIEVEQEQGNGE